MPLSLRYAAHSEVGLVRHDNQDSAYVSPRMLVVADGMGGAAAGDLASALAVHVLADADADLDARIEAASRRRTHDTSDQPAEPIAEDVLSVLDDCLRQANTEIADLVAERTSLQGMGTTVCAFVLIDDAVAYTNIGDSRAYLLREGTLSRITRDHSWVQTLVDEGRITEQEALEHPHRSLIMRVLNGNPAHEPDFAVLELRAGDRLLLCSDGLSGLVTDAAIATKIEVPDRERAVASLVDLAHDAGGYDNITLVVADVVDDIPAGETALFGSARTTALPVQDLAPATPLDASASITAQPGSGRPTRRQRLTEEERYGLRPARRRGRLRRAVLLALLPLLVLGGGAFALYGYSQTQFYIGPHDTTVAVFQGVPDRIAGLSFSQVVNDDGPKLADLPPYYVKQVRGLIAVPDAEAGGTRLEELKVIAAACVAQREARAQATAAPATPATTLIETPGATPTSLSPSPSPTGPATPEDC